MPHTRRLPRIAPTGSISLRLTTAQRDLFIHSPALAPSLGHALHRAPVRDGKLTIRVKQPELDALIAIAARHHPADKREQRAHETLLRYLEKQEDRFAEPDDETDTASEE